MYKVLFDASVETEETGDGWNFTMETELPFVPTIGMSFYFCDCCSACEIKSQPTYEVHKKRFVVNLRIDFHNLKRPKIVEHFLKTGWTENKEENDVMETMIARELTPSVDPVPGCAVRERDAEAQ